MSDICVVGVDPGLSGAIAFFFPEYPDRIAVEDMPVAGGEVSAALLAELVVNYQPTLAVIEQVAAGHGWGRSACFNFGRSVGDVRGCLAALAIPIKYISPVVWKKHYRLSRDKDESRARALQLFPSCAEHFKRKKDDGRAEAALIAKYGAEMLYDWKRSA